MKIVFQAKDLWEVVSSEEVKLEAEKAIQAWEKKARKRNSVSPLATSASIQSYCITDCKHILVRVG